MTVSRWIECSYKRALGDPTSADALRHAFYRQIVHGVFKYERYRGNGFTFSIATTISLGLRARNLEFFH